MRERVPAWQPYSHTCVCMLHLAFWRVHTHRYADGGVRRFYRGYGPALFQGPLSRFGDTAANSGMLSLLDSKASTRDLPIPVKTACASTAAALWRIALMPIDATKTIMQVSCKCQSFCPVVCRQAGKAAQHNMSLTLVLVLLLCAGGGKGGLWHAGKQGAPPWPNRAVPWCSCRL